MFTSDFWNAFWGLVFIILFYLSLKGCGQLFKSMEKGDFLYFLIIGIILLGLGLVFGAAGITLIQNHPVVLRPH